MAARDADTRGAHQGTPDELLGVAQVMARYGLRDRRAARRAMDAAGAFVVGRRLLVRESDLVAYEERLRADRRSAVRAERSASPAHRHAPRSTRGPVAPPLPAGWWRQEAR